MHFTPRHLYEVCVLYSNMIHTHPNTYCKEPPTGETENNWVVIGTSSVRDAACMTVKDADNKLGMKWRLV